MVFASKKIGEHLLDTNCDAGHSKCDAVRLSSRGWQKSQRQRDLSCLHRRPQRPAHVRDGPIEGRAGEIECCDCPSKRRPFGPASESYHLSNDRNAVLKRVERMSWGGTKRESLWPTSCL